MTGDERDDETAQVTGNVTNIASGPVNGMLIQLGHFGGDLIMHEPTSDEPASDEPD